MKFENVQNLLLTENFKILLKEIQRCDNSIYKKGIKLYCHYKINNVARSKYNPYFYFLLNKDIHNVINDLKNIDDLYANYYLGLYYFSIYNLDLAFEYFSKYSNACYTSYIGQIMIEKGELLKGITLLNNSKSFILSSFYLANCYSNNYGVHYDFNTCESLYKYCADLGYLDAIYHLAVLYISTDQIKYGPKYCLDLMEKAALKYHTKSYMYVLYYYYLRDEVLFDKWFEYLKSSDNKELIQLIANDFKYGYNFEVDEVKSSILYNL
ncbi:MAG: hypothetical protein WDA47_07930 [Bacilli bacterium]